MAYEFEGIQLLSEEGKDWWQTLRRIPTKILNQDFGKEVPLKDLVEPSKKHTGESSPHKDKESPVFDIDNLKLKEEVVKASGYSKVTLPDSKADKPYFEVEIFTRQFDRNDYSCRIEKGFIIVSGCQKEIPEGEDAAVWRKFERRYMLPHDINITNVKLQMKVRHFDGGITVKVYRDPQPPSPKKNSPPKKSTPC